jgi:hypothetical protein
MKSKQINFFLFGNDLKYLDEYLKQNQWEILSLPARSPENAFVDSLFTTNEFGTTLFKYAVPKYFRNKVHFEKGEKKCDIDMFSVPAVEILLGMHDEKGNFLRRGRLFYYTEYNKEGVTHQFSEDFLKECDALFRWFRKQYVLKKTGNFKGFYTSKEVDVWEKEGGELRQV